MTLPFLNAEFLRSALDYPTAVAALRAGYAAEANVPPRLQMTTETGRLWLMPAESAGALGVKLVTQCDRNPARGLSRIQGIYMYLDAETGQLLALLDGRVITEIRTAAISALATTLMANPDPATLAIFGTGVQAQAHLAAMRALFEIREVLVCGSDPAKSEAFAKAHGCRAASSDECAAAQLICTCTTSITPVFDGGLLRPGTHINAVGNSRIDGRELDWTTVHCSSIAVDDRKGAAVESGDLIDVAKEKILADLPELVRGDVKVREHDIDITLFKSVGFALGDLLLARLAYQKRTR
jgi:ornithine cyclodeaminase/alanine dehydrogenase-like protein (mu-crystallin family)